MEQPTVEEQLAELRQAVAELRGRLDRAMGLLDLIRNPMLRKLVRSRIEAP